MILISTKNLYVAFPGIKKIVYLNSHFVPYNKSAIIVRKYQYGHSYIFKDVFTGSTYELYDSNSVRGNNEIQLNRLIPITLTKKFIRKNKLKEYLEAMKKTL